MKLPNLPDFVAAARSGQLNGYTDTDAKRKHAFHRDGRTILLELAKRAELTKVKIRSNKAGPAISGEVMLDSAELFVQLAGNPGACSLGILYRRGKDGPNRWAPWESLASVEALGEFAALLRGVAKEPYARGT